MPEPEETTTETTETQEAPETPDEGKGSKASVLADLASERDRRQAAEKAVQAAEQTGREAKEQLDKVLQALGLAGGDEQPDVDALTADLRARERELAVLRVGAKLADVDALLDSRAFTDSLSKIDPSDRDAVTAHIKEFVEQNPRFSLTPKTPSGSRDAGAGSDTKTGAATINDMIRAAAGR